MKTSPKGLIAAAALAAAVACSGSPSAPPGSGGAANPPPSPAAAPDSSPAVALVPPGSASTPGAKPPAPPTGSQPAAKDDRTPDPGLKVVRELTNQFYRGDLVHLHDRFSAEMKKTLSVEQLAAMRAKMEQDYGKEVALIGEDWKIKDRYRGFVRWARFDKSTDPIEIQWILHLKDDEVAGFFMRPTKRTEVNR